MKLKTRTAPAALPAPGARAYVVPSPSACGVGHPHSSLPSVLNPLGNSHPRRSYSVGGLF